MVETVRDGHTMLLVPDVVDECFNVFQRRKPDTASAKSIYMGGESGDVYELFDTPITREDFDVEPRSRGDFDRLLAECLRGCDIEFAAVRPNPDTLDAAMAMRAEKKYRDRRGMPLSRVDCTLLRLAIENRNVDIITDDLALAWAVSVECGKGRAYNALAAYFGRLNMTARFLSEALNVGFIDCNPIRGTIEYRAADRGVLVEVYLSHDGVGAASGSAIRDLERGGVDDAVHALLSFVRMVVLDWYCACGDVNWDRFDREWSRVEWNFDTMQITGKTRRPHYETARRILEECSGRYCACSKPDECRLHEEFRAIMAEVD